MAELYDIVLQTIKDRCPKLNWKLGGVLRELLVEPISSMQTAVSTYLSGALSSLDISSALANPAKYEDVLDDWMDRLKLSLPPKNKPQGVVAIITEELQSELLIPIRTSMDCSGIQLTTTQEYRFTANNTTKISAECYACYVNVVYTGELAVNIADGSPVTWTSAPAEVQDVYIASAVTGGSSEGSAQAKANLITHALSFGSVVGDEAIAGALSRAFPGMFIDAKSERSEAVIQNSIPLYVKSKKLPAIESTQLVSTVVDGEESLPLSVDGITEILGVIDNEGRSIEYEVRWAGIRPIIVCTNSNQSRSLVVSYRRFSDIAEAASWLNSSQRALPYRFTCTAPAVAHIRLFINTGGVPIDLETRTKIQEYICDKPLNATLTDAEVVPIMTAAGYNVSGAIMYSVDIVYRDYRDVWSSSGVLNLAGQLGLSGAPTAMYSTAADITGC